MSELRAACRTRANIIAIPERLHDAEHRRQVFYKGTSPSASSLASRPSRPQRGRTPPAVAPLR